MSTRAVIYVHKKGVRTPKGKLDVKIYQHCDGYETGLGINLIRGFKERRGDYSLDYCLKRANRYHQNKFEITTGKHADVEYIYHIYHFKNGKFLIKYQTGGFGEDELIEETEEFLCDNVIGEFRYSMKDKDIEDWTLYNIKQRTDNIDTIEGNYYFMQRFDIHDIGSFKDKTSVDVDELKRLREQDKYTNEEKNLMEDAILKRILDKIEEQHKEEKGKYFSSCY